MSGIWRLALLLLVGGSVHPAQAAPGGSPSADESRLPGREHHWLPSDRRCRGPHDSTNTARSGRSQLAGVDPVQLLRRGDQAERTAVFYGVKVIRATGDCQARGGASGRPMASNEPGKPYERSVRIWHGGPGQTRLEFLRAGGGAAPVVIENGSQRWCYSPRRNAWRPIAWHAPEPRLELLLRNYRVIPAGEGKIAGRRVLQVRIEPRYPGNPRKCSWLDLSTGIALRSDLYDRSGHRVSTSEFLQFEPRASLPPYLFQPPAGGAPEPVEAGEARFSNDPALPRRLPRGYVLDRLTRTRRGGAEIVRARYTDGLNVLSLTHWRGPGGPGGPGDPGNERFRTPGEQLRWTRGDLTIVLAGDLDRAELRRIAASVRAPYRAPGALVSRK
jgi:hypothetical protein